MGTFFLILLLTGVAGLIFGSPWLAIGGFGLPVIFFASIPSGLKTMLALGCLFSIGAGLWQVGRKWKLH